MTTVFASAAVLIGAAFMFVAALGVARFPDLYTRMQAATKASTVGVVGVMCAVGLAHYEVPATVRAILIAVFFLMTSPIAAHAIARSAHTRDIPLAPGTRVDAEGRVGDRLAPSARVVGDDDHGPETPMPERPRAGEAPR